MALGILNKMVLLLWQYLTYWNPNDVNFFIHHGDIWQTLRANIGWHLLTVLLMNLTPSPHSKHVPHWPDASIKPDNSVFSVLQSWLSCREHERNPFSHPLTGGITPFIIYLFYMSKTSPFCSGCWGNCPLNDDKSLIHVHIAIMNVVKEDSSDV